MDRAENQNDCLPDGAETTSPGASTLGNTPQSTQSAGGVISAERLNLSKTPPGLLPQSPKILPAKPDCGIVPSEANTGVPLRGDFERMARRRFQNPKPFRRGAWWYLQYWRDDLSRGSP